MADNNIDLQLLLKRVEEVLAGQKEARAAQEALTAKIGTIATSMVSMNKRLDDLTNSNHLVAVAVDDHSHQLTEIKTRLDVIEKKLDRTHV